MICEFFLFHAKNFFQKVFFLETYDYSFIFFTFMYWEISRKVFRESVFSFDLIHVVFLFKIERILSVGKCHQVRRKLWFHLTPTKEKLWFHRHRLKSVRLRMYWEGRRKLIGSCWCYYLQRIKVSRESLYYPTLIQMDV